MATARIPRDLFLARLRESGLVAPRDWRDAEAGLPDAGSGRAAARALVERGLLTRFQAERLLAGRTDGFVLGRYVVRDEVGRGGMGRVFLARDTASGKDVALKVLPARLARTPKARRMFVREVRAAARLNHPNIVSARDAGAAGGRLFLAMEFVDGPNLADLVAARGPLPVGQACDMARQAALGLQHAHEHGLVHRDIKPHNLLAHADAAGRVAVKILDFGLARLGVPDDPSAGQWSQLSSLDLDPNAVLGTPDFVAPEQARDLNAADTRSDLYALGGTLYYLLTGRVPFPGGGAIEKLVRHATEEPTPVEHLRPDVPPGLAAVVRRLLAKRPADRYATPAEAAVALAPWAGGPGAWEPVGPLVPPPLAALPFSDVTTDTPAPHGGLALGPADDEPEGPRRRGLGLALFAVLMFAAGAAAGWLWLGPT